MRVEKIVCDVEGCGETVTESGVGAAAYPNFGSGPNAKRRDLCAHHYTKFSSVAAHFFAGYDTLLVSPNHKLPEDNIEKYGMSLSHCQVIRGGVKR